MCLSSTRSVISAHPVYLPLLYIVDLLPLLVPVGFLFFALYLFLSSGSPVSHFGSPGYLLSYTPHPALPSFYPFLPLPFHNLLTFWSAITPWNETLDMTSWLKKSDVLLSRLLCCSYLFWAQLAPRPACSSTIFCWFLHCSGLNFA